MSPAAPVMTTPFGFVALIAASSPNESGAALSERRRFFDLTSIAMDALAFLA
jgi:hypothetical protein